MFEEPESPLGDRRMRASLVFLALAVAACTASPAGSPAPEASVAQRPVATVTSPPSPSASPTSAASVAVGQACAGEPVDWSDLPPVAQSYSRAWNERDASARLDLLREALGDNASFSEPPSTEPALGLEGISNHIADFQEGRDGVYFEPLPWSAADHHHDRMRIRWRLCDRNDIWLIGVDVTVVDARGRLTEIADFFNEPAAFESEERCAGADSSDWSRVPQFVRKYGEAWMAPDDETRLALLDDIWAEDGYYVDPYVDGAVIGRQALNDHMAYAMAPGHYVEVAAWTDGDNLHHDRLWIPWRHCCPTGAILLEGDDFGEIDADGRLRRMTSFWNNEVELPADVACD
jgi:hypothetical protein